MCTNISNNQDDCEMFVPSISTALLHLKMVHIRHMVLVRGPVFQPEVLKHHESAPLEIASETQYIQNCWVLFTLLFVLHVSISRIFRLFFYNTKVFATKLNTLNEKVHFLTLMLLWELED